MNAMCTLCPIRSVRATRAERERPLPGDEVITNPIGTLTHAITIGASRRSVWRWLAQMGAGRAGWYSHDAIDNGGQPSAEDILPRFQEVTIGALFPALPGATDGFFVLACEPHWYLVLGWPTQDGGHLVTWCFALEELGPERTRLIVRVRGGRDYPFYGLSRVVGMPFIRTAAELDLQQSRVVRAIFKGRELILGADPDVQKRPRGLLALTRQLGWGVLAENPGREIVMGAVTQPWKGNVVFRALPPEEFAGFDEPDFVKIVWTLRADPLSATESISRTETRAVATDAAARAKFRRYWACASPGIILIRWVSVGLVKQEAERRFRERSVTAVPLERSAG